MEEYSVIIIDLKTQREQQVMIEVDEAEMTENIVIHATIAEQEIVSSHDIYLVAYQEFRDELLHMGFGMKCNGSRLNAVQSGMMGATNKVYLVEMGKKALLKDIVSIWEYADLENFPDTRQQQSYFEQWSHSFGSK